MSARSKVRDFILAFIEDGRDVSLLEVVAAARAQFDRDRAFRDMLFDEAIHTFVADDLRNIMTARRPPGGAEAIRNRRAVELLALMQESVGPGVRKAILNMTRPEGLYSIEVRERRIASEEQLIRFERDVFENLPNDTTTVGAYYSDDDLQRKWDAHFA